MMLYERVLRRAAIGLLFLMTLFFTAALILHVIYGVEWTTAMYERRSISLFDIPPEKRVSVMAHWVSLAKALIIATTFSWLGLIAYLGRRRITGMLRRIPFATRQRIWTTTFVTSVYTVCSYTTFLSLYMQGSDQPWSPIEKLMNFSLGAPFQRRVLLIWVANEIRALRPDVSYLEAYFLSQILPMALLFYFIHRWTSLFVPFHQAFMGQIVLAILMIPTFGGYWTFWDVTVVLVSTVCLWLLLSGRLFLYLLVFVIGTLNHEITLFLVVVFVAVFWERLPRLWPMVAAQIALWIAVRTLQLLLVPAGAWWSGGRIWFNLDYLFRSHFDLSVSVLLLPWYILAALSVKRAPRELQRCLILLPLLVGQVLLVGHINEIRVFNSFIPVVVVLATMTILSAITRPASSGLRPNRRGDGGVPEQLA